MSVYLLDMPRTPAHSSPFAPRYDKSQLQRWESAFPHHSHCEYFHKCLFSLSAFTPLPLLTRPSPSMMTSIGWNFFGRKFFVAVKIDVEIFMAHAMLTKRDPARTQCDPSAKSAQLIGYSAQELLTQCAAFACSTRRGAPLRIPPYPIQLGRKFFSQILNCRSGMKNKREKKTKNIEINIKRQLEKSYSYVSWDEEEKGEAFLVPQFTLTV